MACARLFPGAVLALLIGIVLRAQDPVLIGLGETWRYAGAPANGTTNDLAWIRPDYDDSGWLVGPSGFGDTRYGGEHTLLYHLPNAPVLFRKTFVVDQPEGVRWLVFRADHAGGYVAYLNGREALRRGGLTNGPGPGPGFQQVPAPRAYNNAEEHLLDPSLLVPGTNVLAIQVHADQFYAVRPILVPELLANLSRPPHLQNVTSNRATIRWTQPAASPARVEFGSTPALGRVAESPSARTTHEVVLDDLLPGQDVHYRVVLLPSAPPPETAPPIILPARRFRTLPAAGPLRVLVFGDSGAGTPGQRAVANALSRESADLVLHTGDIIYPYFMPGLVDTRLFSPYRRIWDSIPMVFAWGNHDLTAGSWVFTGAYRQGLNDVRAEDHVRDRTFPEAFFSFDAGDVHFAVAFQPFASQYLLTTNSAQYAWLLNDLRSTTRPWKVLVCHHPWNTSGNHRFTDSNLNGIPDRVEVAATILPLARRTGVHLLLHGHDHTFERFLPVDGVHTVITGGGGGPLYNLREHDPASVQFFSTFHFTRLAFEGDTLQVQAVGTGGHVFDGFRIQRRPPPVTEHGAGWFTPQVEPPDLPRRDGNLAGQAYDFQGLPEIQSFTGRESNLGRMQVALDATHLHLGFESVMLPPEADLFLFLETPRQPGVESLSGLGNGRPDPADQGADGLDFLENLSFDDFSPSVAAILGDEFADQTLPGFGRTTNGPALGQGVFRLTPDLTPIPGVRLQQFNRSPEDGAIHAEKSADFIELSVPRTALGNLQPGDVIRLGVVVGLGSPDPAGGTRRLDTGFFGNRLEPGPDGTWSLTGLAVRLPPDPDPDADGLSTDEERALGTDPQRRDSDGDGLPDGWEVTWNLNPLQAGGPDGGSGDPDNDGYVNLEELFRGSRPQDPVSPGPVLSANREAAVGEGLRLSWRAGPGRRYVVETAPALTGPFVALPGFPREAVVATEGVSIPIEGENRFYRVRLVQP